MITNYLCANSVGNTYVMYDAVGTIFRTYLLAGMWFAISPKNT